MIDVLIYTFFVGVIGTGLGGCIGALFKKDSNQTMSLLLSFAGGIMLAIVCFDLIPEAIQPLGTMDAQAVNQNTMVTLLAIVLSVAVIYLLNYLIDKVTANQIPHVADAHHPKTHDHLDELIHSDHLMEHSKHADSKASLLRAGMIMVIAIALHNIPEGIAIGSSYSNEVSSGIIIAFLIGFHNIPEGMATTAPLISGGMKKWKAVLITALVGAPTMLGAGIGYAMGSHANPMFLTISLAVASGAMIYVVFGEILPQSYLMCRSKLPAFFAIFGILIGILLVYLKF